EEKTLRYAMNASNASGAIVDENNPIPVENSSHNHVYVEGTPSGVPSGVSVTKANELQEAIDDYLKRLTVNVRAQIDAFQAARNACTDCYLRNRNQKQVEQDILDRSGDEDNPVIVEVETLSIESDGSFGATNKPIILIVNNINLNKNNL